MKHTIHPIMKAIISVGFGAIAFYINFHAINFFQFPQFKVSILMGLLFPLVITLAWGWRYGLLSALAGGCQSMWWLWQSDGYGFLYAVPIFTLWIVWHGVWSDYRKRHKSTKWYHSMYAVELLFRIFSELGFYTVFRWLVSLNPPPWAPEISWSQVTYSWVHFVAIKHIITAYVLLLLCHVLLSMGPVRRFFGLDPKPEQNNTTYIISASILLGLCIWLIDDVVVYLAFYEGSGSFFEVITSEIAPHDLFVRTLFFLICLISGLLISKLLLQRFKGEKALMESEDKYRSLVETLTDFVFIVAPDGSFTYLNPEFEKLTGYSDQEFIGHSFTEVLAPEYIESTVNRFKRGLSGDTIPIYEVEIKHKDGKTVPVELKATSLLNADGKTIGRIGVARDIRERKQAEKALRESETSLKAVLGASPVGIGLVVNRKLDWANETMYRMVGYEANSLLGQSAGILYSDDEEYERAGQELYAGLEESGTGQAETRWIRKDGTIFDCILRICSLDPSDPGKGQIVAVTDVSKLKLVHEKLRKSEAEKKAILDGITTTIRLVNENLEILWVNKAGGASVDKSPEEMIGHKCYEFWGDQEQTCANCPAIKTIREKRTSQILRHAPDEKVWDLKAEPVVDHKGNLVGVVEIAHDITDKLRLETQLHQAQKMEAIGTLAGGVAHDLNNILGGLVSYPELLLLQLPKDSPLRKSILTIQKSGEKAAAVVQDLLTLARRGVVVTDVVNLNNVIAEYLKSPEHENLESYHLGVHIETHLEKDTLNILGSSTHLSKTVMNLISNAAEAMPEGGKITVSTDNRYIDRPIRGYDDVKEGDYVVLTISDTGTGISPDDIEKIFEPFYTKKKMGRSGTGLGMAVVWGTIKDHNGYIDVQSTEGKARPPRLSVSDPPALQARALRAGGGQGTTFTLYFPVTRKSVEEKFEISLKDYIGNGEAILIVDDVEEQRQIASGMLEELGYSVVSVSSGEEAVEYLKTHKVDLLLLDMIMDPGIDGLDTYKKILEVRPGQKAIIASGFSETDSVKEVLNLGAAAYIRKPLLLEKIGIAVKEELGK